MRTSRVVASIVLAVGAAAIPEARAQLRPDQVLVVYDSRLPGSRSVAEYYAGSRLVPGGAGGFAGVRPGVRVVDLAFLGQPAPSTGDITQADFVTRIRNPLRSYLSSNNLTRAIRCIVTTKGMPHRIQDTNFPAAGDLPGTAPGQFVDEVLRNDITCASVDTELMLLWQNLDAGEAGNANDSQSDGVIVNPFWRQTRSIQTWSNQFLENPKTLTAAGIGPQWNLAGLLGTSSRLNPGDLYLVCRLDGATVSGTRAMIDRAQNLMLNMAAAGVVLDKDPNNFDAVTSGNAAFPGLLNGNDYDQTNTFILNDGRFRPAPSVAPTNVMYNTLAGAGEFVIGPNLTFSAGRLTTAPLVLLATYGANHNGVPTLVPSGDTSADSYATSFNLAPGAIFNTIESYNGRDFGGVGPLSWLRQQQATNFLGAGGTFALCNVWEPLADTVPDNLFLMQNFVLGNMSYAEAAWSSVPGLSWQQMVVGDPLARMSRSSEDLRADGRMGVDDIVAWERSPSDVNKSGAANASDRALVVASVRAAERVNVFAAR